MDASKEQKIKKNKKTREKKEGYTFRVKIWQQHRANGIFQYFNRLSRKGNIILIWHWLVYILYYKLAWKTK